MVVLGLPEGGWRLPSALRGGHRCEGSKSLMIAHIMRMYFPLDFDHSRQYYKVLVRNRDNGMNGYL